MRLLLIGLLGLLSCQVGAETVAYLEVARDALARFNQAQPYLVQREDQEETARKLSAACTTGGQADCIAYIRKNRVRALQALPDNPQYWEHLESFLATQPVGIDPGENPWATENPRLRLSKLLDAVQHWGWYQIARHGEMDAAHLARQLRNARYFLTTSNSAVEKQLAGAWVSIFSSWIPVALATAADRFDDSGLQALEDSLWPKLPHERNWTAVFDFEAALVREWLAQGFPTIDEYRVMYGENVSGDDYLEQKELALAFVQHLPELREIVDKLARQTDAHFWRFGPQFPASPAEAGVSRVALNYIDVWQYMVSSDYLFNLRMHILLALTDIHKGVVSPGLPVRPPPAQWRWDWQLEDQLLCLEGVDLHPQAVKVSVLQQVRMCEPYLEAPAARL